MKRRLKTSHCHKKRLVFMSCCVAGTCTIRVASRAVLKTSQAVVLSTTNRTHPTNKQLSPNDLALRPTCLSTTPQTSPQLRSTTPISVRGPSESPPISDDHSFDASYHTVMLWSKRLKLLSFIQLIA